MDDWDDPEVRRSEVGGARRPALIRTGLPGSEEADHLAATETARSSRQEYAGSVERRQQAGDTTERDTAPARPSGRADERPQCRTHAGRAVMRASARIVCKTSSGENWCRRNSLAGRSVDGMIVVFGLVWLVVLLGLFPVVEFVSVDVFLLLSDVGHFDIFRSTILPPGLRVPPVGLLSRRL